MMGKQTTQIQMVILDLDSMIPKNHLLRQIKSRVNFDVIYEIAAPYYSNVGRKSVDPVILIKMLLIGYLYGIKSERRLIPENHLLRQIKSRVNFDFIYEIEMCIRDSDWCVSVPSSFWFLHDLCIS